MQFFSLGGILSRVVPMRGASTPWVIIAIALCACSSWDFLARGGRFDFILLGLAGYELVIGLTEEVGSRQ